MSCVAAHAGGVQLPESPSPRDISSINRYIRGVLEIENRESFHRTVPKLGEPGIFLPSGMRSCAEFSSQSDNAAAWVMLWPVPGAPCLIGPTGS